MTAFSIKEAIDRFGVRQVAAEAGIPFWTLRKWRDNDEIPGPAWSYEERRQRLMAALEALEARKVKAAKKRKAA